MTTISKLTRSAHGLARPNKARIAVRCSKATRRRCFLSHLRTHRLFIFRKVNTMTVKQVPITVEMVFSKSTKGAHVYAALDAGAAPVTQVYMQRTRSAWICPGISC
jgi:hypothetical protein